MRKYFYYVTTIAISTFLSGCSAAYWSGASFEGDDMYGTHPTSSSTMSYNQNRTAQEVASSAVTSYGYQRPDSYYQYQYVTADGAEDVVTYDPSTYTAEQVATKSVVVIDPKYASSTYGVWEEEPSVASNVYVNVSYGYSSYNPWWGWGYGYYDPFFYNDWRYPHYYSYNYPYYGNWWWHRPRPIYVSKRPKQNIVHLPSSGGGSSTRYKNSKSYRGQSVGTTTSGKFSRASTMFNTNNSSSSSSTKSSSSSSKTQSSSSSSSSSSRSSTYTAPVRPTTTTTPSTSSPTRSYSTPSSSSSSSSSRSSSGGGSSSR